MATRLDNDLRLRPADPPADIALAVPWYSDPEVLYCSEGPSVEAYDAERIRGMYDYLARIGEPYIIEVRTQSGWLPIGDATLAPHTMPIVIVHPQYRGCGLGKRVIAMLVQRARVLGWGKLSVKSIYTYNHRSRRAYESAGFQVVETQIDDNHQESWRLELQL